MKIVVIGTRGIPNIQGGVETHCQELYPRLSVKGHEITVMRRSCYVTEKNWTRNYKGVALIDVFAPKYKSIEAIVHTAISVFKAYRLKPDILHVHAIGPSLLIPIAKMLGMKVVMTHHGFDYKRQKWGKFAKSMLKLGERIAMRYADGVIAVSDNIADELRRKHGRQDISVIYNGVNVPDVSEIGDDRLQEYGLKGKDYIFAMGRLVPEKGFHDLISAYCNLPDEMKSRYKLVIAGDADYNDNYANRLKRIARKIPEVIMTGFLTGKPLNQLLANAALYVTPSYHEGLPIALLEAMSYGLDVVVSDIKAHRLPPIEHIDCFFPVGDTSALTKIIEKKLSQQEKGGSLTKIYDLSMYDWNTIAANTEHEYRKALSLKN